MTVRAVRIAAIECRASTVNPAEVRSGPGSRAQTISLKRGTPRSVRSSPKTRHGTER